MKVISADFVTSAAASGVGIPRDGVPHVALAGRSNVGKSSLINALTRRTIARTSAAPGKTRLANIYRVELEVAGRLGFYLVDLPGYGYARGGADSADELKRVAEAYFRGSTDAPLKRRATSAGVAAVLLLVDARHPGLDTDRRAAGWLDSLGVEAHVVATKIDKLTRSERARNLKAIGDTFGTAALPVSATSGEGLDELWRMIVKIVKGGDRGE